MSNAKATFRNGGRNRPRAGRPVVITGGSGFIGANLAGRLLADGETVVLYDNLSREGVEKNFEWLRETYGSQVTLEVGDTRDAKALAETVRNASAVFHFAAQVAVTTSLSKPRFDFEVNALGTLNLLDALRGMSDPPPLVFTSTNKVYGSLQDVELRERAGRYEPVDAGLRATGIGEGQRLEFYSPYGCSKGTADQYVLDHARMYGLPAVVFRMSCIYGPHQFGTEDQGWVAHFLIQAMEGRPITIYGDGKQVRDILFVNDLVEALLQARQKAAKLAGHAFNIGGGAGNTISLLELVQLIARVEGSEPRITWDDWRPGDQRYYVSDFSRFQEATGWTPRVGVNEGIERLYAWLQEARAPKSLAEVA
jgi:CDP-paratose 2-epimerase